MKLFRSLAAGGSTIVVTTHAMANIELLDLVVLLAGGRLVYAGPPAALLDHFGSRSYEGVFKRLADGSPLEWASKFRSSSSYHRSSYPCGLWNGMRFSGWSVRHMR